MSNPLQRPTSLPSAFRVTSITRLPGKKGNGITNLATLYHEDCSLQVTWQSAHIDVRLKRGCYVAVRGLDQSPQQDHYPIRRLDLLDKPLATLNPFETIPTTWVRDRTWVTRASALWEQLSRPFQHILTAVLWDGARLERFICGPAALAAYRPLPNANLRHAVETAEQAMSLAHGLPDVSHSVLIAAALLHDAGKADDFRLVPERDGYSYSERGQLIGYRYTVLEWLAVARGKDGVVIPETHYLALIHALTASRTESGIGIRDARTIEATLLAVADRICTSDDWLQRDYQFSGTHLRHAALCRSR